MLPGTLNILSGINIPRFWHGDNHFGAAFYKEENDQLVNILSGMNSPRFWHRDRFFTRIEKEESWPIFRAHSQTWTNLSFDTGISGTRNRKGPPGRLSSRLGFLASWKVTKWANIVFSLCAAWSVKVERVLWWSVLSQKSVHRKTPLTMWGTHSKRASVTSFS